MKHKILLVDDDPNVLQGLRRMLRSMRDQWDLRFASGGEEALRMLAEEPADVVVSDMKMAGMDGAEFLSRVKELYPASIRIVLSGHSDRQLTLKATRTAHQFLAKPCAPEVLKEKISRAISLRDTLNGCVLRSSISGLETLPSLPSLYNALLQEMEVPDVSLERVGRLIEQDLAMSTKVLQMVNSAFFGLPREVNSPSEACILLGLETVRSLVLVARVFEVLPLGATWECFMERLWEHSIRTGSLARILAQHERASPSQCRAVFLGGMLHDCGKLVLAHLFPGDYGRLLHMVKVQGRDLHLLEKELFGATHAEVGAYLLGLWGLDQDVVEVVAYHHVSEVRPMRNFDPTAVVVAADTMETRMQGSASTESICQSEPPPQLSGFSDRWKGWVECCLRRWGDGHE